MSASYPDRITDDGLKVIAKAICFLGLCIVRAAVAASLVRSIGGITNAQTAVDQTVKEFNRL